MQDPHDDLKLALRTVKRLLETAEAEEAAPDETKRLLFENVERLVFEVEKAIGAPPLQESPGATSSTPAHPGE